MEPAPYPRIFVLSPANAGGERARMVLNERAQFDVATKLRHGTVTVGELFSFISGLYFRGKLAYAKAFEAPPPGVSGSLVITPGCGLVPPETLVDLEQFRQIAAVPVEPGDPRYRNPLERDARRIAAAAEGCAVVLLGSVASGKYLQPLRDIFGERLLFPAEFVGRGDMSRGGLMLRAVRAGMQLTYVCAERATRHGPRPPRLPRHTASG